MSRLFVISGLFVMMTAPGCRPKELRILGAYCDTHDQCESGVCIQSKCRSGMGDFDGDGLTNGQETNVFHTDPSKKDTDGDGVDDYDEVYFDKNGNRVDTPPDDDGDGVINALESSKTDPDHDCIPDQEDPQNDINNDTRTCKDFGYECGIADNGCGKSLDCGACDKGYTCNDQHKCVSGCTPKTCADLGYECDQADDGCGGTLDCGSCDSDQVCLANHRCVPPIWSDPQTGLMWQVDPYNGEKTWQDSKSYCSNLTLSGYSDWRLPTINELRSLIRGCPKTETSGKCGVTDDCLEDSCRNDACDGCEDGKGSGPYGGYGASELKWTLAYYWSSSSVVGTSDEVWGVYFDSGNVNSYFNRDGYYRDIRVSYGGYVRCVRSGP